MAGAQEVGLNGRSIACVAWTLQEALDEQHSSQVQSRDTAITFHSRALIKFKRI
jgi:hypothetical protein